MSDEAAASESQAPAKQGMNPLVLVMIASLVTASAVGGGMYFAFASKVEQAASAAADDAEEEAATDGPAAKKKDKNKNKHSNKDPAIYTKLDPPFVVNFEAKGIMRFLQITVEVMSRDKETVELIKQHDPLIRNNLLILFSNQDFAKINSTEGREALRSEATKVIAEAIKSEGGKPKNVEQLYFTSFVMQ